MLALLAAYGLWSCSRVPRRRRRATKFYAAEILPPRGAWDGKPAVQIGLIVASLIGLVIGSGVVAATVTFAPRSASTERR